MIASIKCGLRMPLETVVSDINEKNKQGEKTPLDRDVYVMPSLKVFGAVGALTQAGTGFMAETMVPPMNTTRQRQ